MESTRVKTTITVHGSNGEVMAPLWGHPGHFITGKPRMIKIIQVGPDKETPIEVREGLVGVTVRAMFEKHHLTEHFDGFEDLLPDKVQVAYTGDVVEALREAGKEEIANALWERMERDPLTFYVFEPGTFELLQ